MRLLKVNKSNVGNWLQIPHPTKSTNEIICWVGSEVSRAVMYVMPKPTRNSEYTSIPKGNVCKY